MALYALILILCGLCYALGRLHAKLLPVSGAVPQIATVEDAPTAATHAYDPTLRRIVRRT